MTENIAWAVRSNFSIGESMLSMKEIFTGAEEAGYTHVALADTMTISSMIEAFKESTKHKVDLIYGCRLRVQAFDKEGQYFYPKVFIKNDAALKNLMLVLSNSKAARMGLRYIEVDDFVTLAADPDLLTTSGDTLSVFSSALSDKDITALKDKIGSARIDAEIVSELVCSDSLSYVRANHRALEHLSESKTGRLITSRPILYASDDDADANDALATLGRKQKFSSRWRNIPEDRDLSFKTLAGNIENLSKNFEIMDKMGLARAKVIGTPVDISDFKYQWAKQDICLPQMAKDEFGELVKLIKAAWGPRVKTEIMGFKPDVKDLPEYSARLATELKVLRDMGFSNYFLLVRNIVNWSKDNGIIVGPGRGSVGGSLVAYLLGITDVDPIRFGLIFERFINPERLDLPDVDLDFMSTRRAEVIQYMKDTWGADCVSMISNYVSLQSPSALREPARMSDLHISEYACSKYIPKPQGQAVPLRDAVLTVPEIEDYANKHKDLWDLSLRIEGKMKGLSTHAAGVIVAGEPIVNRGVVEERSGESVVCWDKRVVEEQGLVKIDILGLSTLDILQHALGQIKRNHGDEINLLSIPLDEDDIMTAFSAGETVGVFQFESKGMQSLLKNLAKGGKLTFADITAATALFRPGPMQSGLLEDYVAIRQGSAFPHYEHPSMKPALEETLGVIVYQEQVMKLARDLAGFTMAEADHIRKAMGKKDPAKMAEMRELWVEGCEKTSELNEHISGNLFDKIQMFAGYAFNKSHSVEYSMISYWCMWLKQRYPHEFFAATLELQKEDKLQAIVKDAAKQGIEIMPPDINRSTSRFEIFGDKLLTPFHRVKGLSNLGCSAILEAREVTGGKFDSYDHFRDTVVKRRCNSRASDALVKVGSFAEITPGEAPANHIDRLKDQLELIPGLIMASKLKATRKLHSDKEAKEALLKIIRRCRAEEGGIQPLPRLGRTPKFMVVMDCPTSWEEHAGKLIEGEGGKYIREALRGADLKMQDGYFTALSKIPKVGSSIPNDDIIRFKPYLEEEIKALNPPVILTLGSTVSRTLVPELKGGIMDAAGKVIYDKERDATIVLGINPMMIYHDADKQAVLNSLLKVVADLLQ